MTPERLAEIRQFAEAYKGTGLVRRRPNSAISHRGELIAEIDRLMTERERYIDSHTEWRPPMISKERKRELAVELGVLRAKHAVECTPDGVVYSRIGALDDIAFLPEAQKRALAAEVAELIRSGQVIVTFPQLYVGHGDGEPVAAPDDEQTTGGAE